MNVRAVCGAAARARHSVRVQQRDTDTARVHDREPEKRDNAMPTSVEGVRTDRNSAGTPKRVAKDDTWSILTTEVKL